MTVAFATSSIHLKPLNIVRRTARRVEAVSNPAPDDAPEKVKINYRLYATRRMLQLKNMYSPKTFPPCDYCDGSGFVDCPKCNQGCWKCRHTTLIKCHYCGGTGESTPCLHFMPINYEEDGQREEDGHVDHDGQREHDGDDEYSKKHIEIWDSLNDKETTLYTTEHMMKWKNSDYNPIFSYMNTNPINFSSDTH